MVLPQILTKRAVEVYITTVLCIFRGQQIKLHVTKHFNVGICKNNFVGFRLHYTCKVFKDVLKFFQTIYSAFILYYLLVFLTFLYAKNHVLLHY